MGWYLYKPHPNPGKSIQEPSSLFISMMWHVFIKHTTICLKGHHQMFVKKIFAVAVDGKSYAGRNLASLLNTYS